MPLPDPFVERTRSGAPLPNLVCEQPSLGRALSHQKMLGEFARCLEGKVVALVGKTSEAKTESPMKAPLCSAARFRSLIACAALALFVTGCENRHSGSAPVVAAGPPGMTPAPVADQWLGKWGGPEGTFLQLTGGNGRYEVTIQNLDGPRTFQGIAAGHEMAFERDGVKESLRATNGAETGMKWLSEKADCLTVRAGEGYCRD